MPDVTITIGGRQFEVACQDGLPEGSLPRLERSFPRGAHVEARVTVPLGLLQGLLHLRLEEAGSVEDRHLQEVAPALGDQDRQEHDAAHQDGAEDRADDEGLAAHPLDVEQSEKTVFC